MLQDSWESRNEAVGQGERQSGCGTGLSSEPGAPDKQGPAEAKTMFWVSRDGEGACEELRTFYGDLKNRLRAAGYTGSKTNYVWGL